MAEQPGSRRGVRDLLPATLATAAAGVLVVLLVGGTTSGISDLVGPAERGAVVALAPRGDGLSAAEDGTVSVQVRPALHGALPMLSALALTAVPSAPTRTSPTSIETIVAGVSLTRFVAPVTAGLIVPPDASALPPPPVPPAPSTAPATLANGAVTPKAGSQRKPKSKRAPEALVTAASSGVTAAAASTGDDATRSTEGAQDGRGASDSCAGKCERPERPGKPGKPGRPGRPGRPDDKADCRRGEGTGSHR